MKKHPLEDYLPRGTHPIWAKIRHISYAPGPTPLEGHDWAIENLRQEVHPKPADPTFFRMRADLLVGPQSGEGVHDFSLWVVSRRWFAEELLHDIQSVPFRTDPELWGSDLSDFLAPAFVMETWSQEVFERRLHYLLWAVGPGPDWGSVAARLAQWLDGPSDSFNYAAAVNSGFGVPYWGTGRVSP